MKKQVEITQTLERYSSRFLAFRSRDAYRLQFPLGDFVVRQVPGALGMEWGVLQVTRREK